VSGAPPAKENLGPVPAHGPGIAYGLFVPNAPNLIDPSAFGGAGADTVRALADLDLEERVEPEAVVVISPHFHSGDHWAVQGSARPPCLHDFSGFPQALFRVRYEPPGHPALARALVQAGHRRGLPVELTEAWGLDHGAWAPLLHLLPMADRPVVALSISHRSAEQHVAWGAAIAEGCRDAGVRAVVIGTGSILHRLDRLRMGTEGEWAEGARLEEEVVALALRGDLAGLYGFDPVSWRQLEPEGELAPLFTVLGAMGPGAQARRVSRGQVWGAAGLSILEFLPAP
jgi:4,5-DOPA dioxygenase extradiol